MQAVERLERLEKLALEDKLAYQLFKSQILVNIGETAKGLELAGETLTAVEKMGKQLLLVEAITAKAEALRMVILVNLS